MDKGLIVIYMDDLLIATKSFDENQRVLAIILTPMTLKKKTKNRTENAK